MSRLFPAPGLSRQDVEPRLEGDPQLLDQGQVVDRKLRQPPGGHGSGRAHLGARNRDSVHAGIGTGASSSRPTTPGFDYDLRLAQPRS